MENTDKLQTAPKEPGSVGEACPSRSEDVAQRPINCKDLNIAAEFQQRILTASVKYLKAMSNVDAK